MRYTQIHALARDAVQFDDLAAAAAAAAAVAALHLVVIGH